MKRASTTLAAAFCIALGMTACGPGSAPEGTPETSTESNEVSAQACSLHGWWTCPDDGTEFPWDSETCTVPATKTKTYMRTVCESYCTATCVATDADA
ncbi:hypothetical protein MVI01_30970 [Myxococcus virescens]|uniref:Lipoprotein n=1 Tax=Myxococcus virescens TaxID=83456 RepID=A0A511HCQ5_9BACT|nr:hypothetical protein MVI01_30970 [Myxococcus virescens]